MGCAIAAAVLPCAAQEDGSWPIPGRNLAGLRYSGLDQINMGNVGELTVAWTFSLGVLRGQEAAPIVAEDTMFVVTPYPNILYALDLTKPGAPLKWKYEPKPVAAAQGIACCDTVNRGAAYHDGRVFYNTLDGQTIALAAGTGEELWRTRLGDINIGETITMAPLVVQGKVMVGNSGGEYGVPGLDRRTRRQRRQPGVARLQHRTGCRGADRGAVRAFLSPGPRRGSGRCELAARCLADRRRHGVGLADLRPASS
jgi:glucose dehydrogenase